MFKYLLSILLCSIVTLSSAKVLIKDHVFHPKQYNEGYYDVEPSFVLMEEFNITYQACTDGYAAQYQFKELGVSLPEDFADGTPVFFGNNDNGFYVVISCERVYDPHVFILLQYDRKNKLVSESNLTHLVDKEGVITYFVYNNGRYYFNYEHSDHQTDGPEHYAFYMIYCFDPKINNLLWESGVQVSKNGFIIIDDYIVSGFGGYNTDDYVSLIDIRNGDQLHTTPMPTEPSAAGLAADSIYFTDYQGELYRYLIRDKGIRVTGKGVRLRRGPSTSDEIFTDPFTKKTVYPLQGDVLAYMGETEEWYKVHFMDQDLYISKQFSEMYEGEPASLSDIYQTWNEAFRSRTGEIVRHPFYIITMMAPDSDQMMTIAQNSDNVAFFIGDETNHQFICEGSLYNMHYNPASNTIRYYEGTGMGHEYEVIYVIKDGKLAETWTYSAEPQGNVWTEGEVAVEMKYTQTVNGKTKQRTEEEYSAVRNAIDDSQDYDLSDMYDI